MKKGRPCIEDKRDTEIRVRFNKEELTSLSLSGIADTPRTAKRHPNLLWASSKMRTSKTPRTINYCPNSTLNSPLFLFSTQKNVSRERGTSDAERSSCQLNKSFPTYFKKVQK